MLTNGLIPAVIVHMASSQGYCSTFFKKQCPTDSAKKVEAVDHAIEALKPPGSTN